ncbi:MAG TPA: hypothetical protein VGO06_03015 [Bosea sp. (in: a-proteobacteria)]|jgi:hypothetical protein|uniref:hypothetical protein n=1 Tax=Bosea sp. (in: a-proteobacteria) TaxID=1871050 RepID=UPI002E132BAB|nr:hypothetical protein [Bosea sp. (in: a-proteobacteria)]
MMLPTRRLFALGVAAALLAGCQTTPPLGPGTAIGTIRVDVSRLVQLGVGPRAEVVRTRLEQELARDFAGVRQPGGATLTVAVRGLTLPTYVGGDIDDGATSDYLESLVTVTGRKGEVLATYPILSMNGAGDSGFWFSPGIDERRVERLIVNHAAWIRKMVLG